MKLIYIFVLVIRYYIQKIADCMKSFYVEIVPYQRDAKNGGQRDENLGNVNFFHVINYTRKGLIHQS